MDRLTPIRGLRDGVPAESPPLAACQTSFICYVSFLRLPLILFTRFDLGPVADRRLILARLRLNLVRRAGCLLRCRRVRGLNGRVRFVAAGRRRFHLAPPGQTFEETTKLAAFRGG